MQKDIQKVFFILIVITLSMILGQELKAQTEEMKGALIALKQDSLTEAFHGSNPVTIVANQETDNAVKGYAALDSKNEFLYVLVIYRKKLNSKKWLRVALATFKLSDSGSGITFEVLPMIYTNYKENYIGKTSTNFDVISGSLWDIKMSTKEARFNSINIAEFRRFFKF